MIGKNVLQAIKNNWAKLIIWNKSSNNQLEVLYEQMENLRCVLYNTIGLEWP